MNNLKRILVSKDKSCKAVWFMRQAGRYLPEFQEIRSKNKNFIDLCLNSELSSKITLQPIKRFDLDAAIIFSDILIIPFALGQDVKFTKDHGPILDEFNSEKFLDINQVEFINKLNPIYKAIEMTRSNLDKNKSLIGFVGAPWTLLFYMFNLKRDKKNIKLDNFEKYISEDLVLEKLINFLCIHIENQINAGADVIQIFDSWAGLIPDKSIKDFCYVPNAKIVEFCKKRRIVNICFPKGIKENYERFNQIVKPNGINLDYEIDPTWAKNKLKNVVIQGGMDPKALMKPEKEMLEIATKYIQTFKDIPYVFNLGHGLLPETDPDRVEKLIELYRNT
tara:strand:- start:7092 stop:8096 length:1005 start_codon:yes stop_codon:yes gene_type:complete